MLVLHTWLLAASIIVQRQDTTIVTAARAKAAGEPVEAFKDERGLVPVHDVQLLDIDGDGAPEAFVSIAPSVRQTPTILVYKYDTQHGARRLFEGLVPGELQPVSGRFVDDHTMGFGIDMTVDESGHPGAFDQLLGSAVKTGMSLVRYSTFLHADARKGFLSFVDLSDRALPTPATKTCEDFEFSPVDGLAAGTLAGSGSTRYLVALTTKDVTIYLFHGIRSNETLDKKIWIRARPARATALKVLASGEVQLGMSDGRSEPLAAPR